MLYIAWFLALGLYSVVIISLSNSRWYAAMLAISIAFAVVTLCLACIFGPRWLVFASGLEAAWLLIGVGTLSLNLPQKRE